jgi:hypothetical protein
VEATGENNQTLLHNAFRCACSMVTVAYHYVNVESPTKQEHIHSAFYHLQHLLVLIRTNRMRQSVLLVSDCPSAGVATGGIIKSVVTVVHIPGRTSSKTSELSYLQVSCAEQQQHRTVACPQQKEVQGPPPVMLTRR